MKQWLYNLNELQYDRLLTTLFTHCDTFTCIGNKEQCSKFREIAYECIVKCPLRQNSLSNYDKSEDMSEYEFLCSEKTKQFFKQQSFYRLHWQMIDIHSLMFWKDEHCVFCVLSKCSVEIEMDAVLEKQIALQAFKFQ